MKWLVAFAIAALAAVSFVRAIVERTPRVDEPREVFGTYEVSLVDERTLAETVVRFEMRRDGTYAFDWHGHPPRIDQGHVDGRWGAVDVAGAKSATRYRFVGHPSEPIRTDEASAPDEFFDLFVRSPQEVWTRMIDFETRSVSRTAFNVYRRVGS